ncbi:MAG: tetratricopeptide repeat protein [Chlamydiales bacterium]|nr:tetratricopeptide repeat protein [Chlamydiales bacterium]
MNKFLLLSLLLLFYTNSLPSYELPFTSPYKAKDAQALHIQRIVDFWKEGDMHLTKKEVYSFLEKYPSSEYTEKLHVLMGDLLYQEDNFSAAFKHYNQVKDIKLVEQILPNFLYSLYQGGQYRVLASLIEKYQDKHKWSKDKHELMNFYLAESIVRKNMHHLSPSSELELDQAIKLYKPLLDSKYSLPSLKGITTACQLSQEYEIAAQYQKRILEVDTENKELHLFSLANLENEFNKEAALKSYDEVIALDGPLKSKALFNKALTLFDLERYPDIISLATAAEDTLEKGQVGYFQYFLGRSYFFSKNFKESEIALNRSIKTSLAPEQLQTAYLTLAECALELNDLELIESTVKGYQQSLPEDKYFARILLVKAMVAKNLKQTSAINLYKQLLKAFPNFDNLDKIHFDLAELYQEKKNYSESRQHLLYLAQHHPNSFYLKDALRALINLNVEENSSSQNSVKEQKRLNKRFINDLNLILKHPGTLSFEEEKQAQLQLGKLYFEEKDYKKAISILENFTQKFSQEKESFDAHLLLSFCYEKQKTQLDRYAFHAEKVLSLNPKWPQQDKIHLNLFNSYLKLYQEVEQRGLSDKQEVVEKDKYEKLMAKHLFQALPLGKQHLPKQNLLWLANFYWQPLAEYIEENWDTPLAAPQLQNTQKSIKAFEMALLENNSPLIQQSSDIIEGLKLSKLYGYLSLNSKKNDLLQALVKITQSEKNTISKERLLVLTELAQNKEDQGLIEEAKQWYQLILNEDPQALSYFRSFAELHLAKIQLIQLDKNDYKIENPLFSQILNTLKNLQINRSILLEPIHLEAAISYAEIKASIKNSSESQSELLKLLKNLKQDFQSEDDVMSQDYHQARRQLPKQDKIFQAYIMYLDAKINQLEANIASLNKGNSYEIQTKLEVSASIYNNITSGHVALTPYLYRKAQKELELINEQL